jgi:ABC-type branched-subunit amino acid transport system ATPase component
LARTFQHPALFGTLTIAENLRLAERRRTVASPAAREWLDTLPDELSLRPWMDVVAGAAPDPVRKLADTLRALTMLPKLLLVDEPAAGLTAEEREKLGDLFKGAREHLGCSILLIEHDVPLVFRICDRVTVLSNGALIAEGTPAEVRAHPEVIRAYLGEPI